MPVTNIHWRLTQRFSRLPAFVLAVLFSLSIQGPGFTAQAPIDIPAHVPGELIVRFRAGVPEANRFLARSTVCGTRARAFGIVNGLELVKLPANVSVQSALDQLRHHPEVLYAEPNYIVHATNTPNDPRFGELWGLLNNGQSGGVPGADIDAPRAWDLTTGSENVVVAVIDTGVDYTHSDLSANIFRNTPDCNANGIDDDGNGYIDDCYGIDTVNNDSNPMDDHDHGTHVAGTIGAVGNNALGVVGVNWTVKIMPCKFLDYSGSGYLSDALDCLEYVKLMKDRGVNIIATSNSWGGGGFSQALYDAIDAHRRSGILFIAAAGAAIFAAAGGATGALVGAMSGALKASQRQRSEISTPEGKALNRPLADQVVATGSQVDGFLFFPKGNYQHIGIAVSSDTVADRELVIPVASTK